MNQTTESAVPAPAERQISLPVRVVVSLKVGALLAIANVICVLIFSCAWMSVKATPKAISVTGSAKRAIQSDLVVWSGRISVSDPSLIKGYDALKTATDKAIEYLVAHGIKKGEVTINSIETTRNFKKDDKGNNTDQVTSYELRQTIQVASNDVAGVSEVARNVTGLIKDGVMLESYPPRYIYTKLADLKVTMLAEATRDATARAQQIAGNSGASLGAITEARMGVMQINPLHSNTVSDSGNNDTSSLEKEITAVVSTRFLLK